MSLVEEANEIARDASNLAKSDFSEQQQQPPLYPNESMVSSGYSHPVMISKLQQSDKGGQQLQ